MRKILPFATAAVLAGFGAPSWAASDTSAADTSATATMQSEPTSVDSITADDLGAHIQVLASDAFGGREPGTQGAKKTIDYLISHFKQLGLKPGNNGQWLQQVSVQSTEVVNTDTTLDIAVNGKTLSFDYGDDMVVNTLQGKKHVELNASDIVFVGYGVKAPGRNWNDYKGVDVEGKTVIAMVNDPGFSTHNPALFEGKKMTYYGRWTYKYEEAARQGAKAIFIIHQTEAAGYPWSVVESSWTGPQFALAGSEDGPRRMPLAGWITNEAAHKLFAAAGLDFDKLRKAASQRDFEAIELDATASLELNSKLGHFKSSNVLAKIPGTKHPEEAVIYMAHWDHLGTDPTLEGDQIYNGAADNATGLAGMLEIAQAFKQSEQRPKRSVLFAAVTLEESGLLGSKYYVEHPVFALDQTVAALNVDMLVPIGRAHDITVVGLGQSELDNYLKQAVAKQGRTLSPEPHPEKGLYFRSDHFSFAKAGVPALFIESGRDLIDGGVKAGSQAIAEFTKNRYHGVQDEYDPEVWKMGGYVEDIQALYRVGHTLANNHDFPQWSKDSAFRAQRQQMRQDETASADAQTHG